MRSRRRRDVEADLVEFRRDDSAYDAPAHRRQLYRWRGEDDYSPSRRSLPPPFVKSDDYDVLVSPFIPEAPSQASGFRPAAPLATPLQGSRPVVSYGPSRQTLRSLLRPTFSGTDNPCHGRKVRREVMFAAGLGGRRLGTKRVRRTSDSERSC